jgi:zinc resistance-associated protein
MAAVFILTVALLVAPGTGQADRMRQGGSGGMMGMDMMSQMTAEEQKIVQDIVEKHHGELVDLHKKIFAKRAELNAVMAQEKFDAGKARTMAKEIVSMQSGLMEKKLGMFIEMREKGISYYGTCMVGGRMGPCMMGGSMGSGMRGRGMMMDGGMMGQGMMDGGMMGQDMMQAEEE